MARSYESVQPVPFGGYQLVERLAMGGMAEVYLARPEGQERFVALKRILPSIAADDEFIAMFIDEAKIAGQLNHPNVAQIFDLGKINNSYFIAMEYVSGHDLRAVWDRTRDAAADKKPSLPIGTACYVVKRICDGLDYAHRRRDSKGRPLGIIHRDVSPQNILVSYDGDLKIIDFGIAKAANRIVRTQTGILKGKFAYMAPEQARGEPTDHRADIFAIGVILYELLTGERAFKADSDFALLEKVRRVDLPQPRSLRAEIPKDLERIIAKALAKEAQDRYAWASSLASDLDRFMADQGFNATKEDLGAFITKTFREEYNEEQKRLEAYRRLFRDDSSMSSSSNATVVRATHPSLDSVPSSEDGTSIGSDEGSAATSFEEGRPTIAEVPSEQPTAAQLAAMRAEASRIAKGGMRVEKPLGDETSKSMASPRSLMSEEIDASEEASALGLPAVSRPAMTAAMQPGARTLSNSDTNDISSEDESEALTPFKEPRRQSLGSGPDATQIDPEGLPQESPAPPPPVVARDEVPKKVRVVSAIPPSSSLPKPERITGKQNGEEAREGNREMRDARDTREPREGREARDPRETRETREARERSAPRAERSSFTRTAPAPMATGPVLLAAALGAIIGAGLVGIFWLASADGAEPVVFVTTPRQVEVRRGNEVLCRQTPCAVALEPGRHELRFRSPGAEEVARTVEVKAEGTAPVEVVLERAREDIRIETDPPNAIVTLDGKVLTGATPLTLPKLVVGTSVRLKLVREGYEPLEVSRTVDDEPVWRYELPTSLTTWTIEADPQDALIEGPGRDRDGKLIVTVAKKNVVVRLSRPGCEAQQFTLYATGKRDAQQTVQLSCPKLSAGLIFRPPGKRPQIKIDNTEIPRHAKLDPYPLPPGTYTVNVRGARGKSETLTVEIKDGEFVPVPIKVK